MTTDNDIIEDDPLEGYGSKNITHVDNVQAKEKNLTQTSKNNNNDKQQKQQESLTEIYCQKYVGSDYLAEAVLIGPKPFFAVSRKQDEKVPSIVLEESILLDEFTILKPPESLSYLNKPYAYKSEEEFYQYIQQAEQTDLYSLFKHVKSIWKKYIDADDFHISICAADTIFTYFQEIIGLSHYLFFIGNNGSGKSNNLVIFHILGYRNMMSTDVTAANIYQFLGHFVEGVGTICEDEADNIDENTDKMRIYKNGYSSGFPVFRTDTTYGRKQYRFFTFCFKAFAAEKTPDSVKAKGFNQRIIELHCSPGFPQYDISEIVNPAGEKEHQDLLDELIETRKKLLAFKLLHFHDKIPDVKLNIENREKQLFKPIVRIFQNSTQGLDELLPVITNYVRQKREINANSLHSRIYQMIKRMINEENSTELESGKIWDNIKCELNGEDIKAQTIQTPEFGQLSQKEIIHMLKDMFKAIPSKRHGNARSLIFDLVILDKLGNIYDLDVDIKVKRKVTEDEINENGTHETFYESRIGLIKHLFYDEKEEIGTHGTHGTLSGNGQDVLTEISSDNQYVAKVAKNIDNTTVNNNTKQNLLKDPLDKEQPIIGQNTNVANPVIGNPDNNINDYSYNVSQASQASQIPKSNIKIDDISITKNHNVSQVSTNIETKSLNCPAECEEKKRESYIMKINYFSNIDKGFNNNFFIDLSSLTDTQREIIKSIVRDYFPDALLYLKERGIYIKEIIDDRENEALIKTETDRVIHIANIILEDNKKIVAIDNDLNKMWEDWINEKDPYKGEDILKKMIAIRHYVSAYFKTLYDMMALR